MHNYLHKLSQKKLLMKKIFLIAVVSVMSTALFAQMRVKFGGQLGFNAGTMKQTISIPGQPSQSSTGTSKFGFVGGLLPNILRRLDSR